MNILMRLMRWFNVLLVAITLVAYLAPFINPAHWSIPAFFGLAYPVFLCAHILLVLFWTLVKRRYALLSLACLLAGLPYLNDTWNWSRKPISPEHTANVVKVLSYNVQNLNHHEYKGDKRRIAAAQPMLNIPIREQVTFFCAQEFGNSRLTSRHAQNLRENGHLSHYYGKRNGLHIFSRYPFINKGNIAFENTQNACLYVDVQLNKDTLRIYNLHLESLRFGKSDYEVLQNPDLEEKNTWRKLRSVAGKIKRASTRRAEQANTIKNHIAQSPYPVIVCGDFNDTPVSYTYRQITAGLQDTFQKKGKGFGATYAGPLPALRIDYILTSQRFRVLSHTVLREADSDHYPVVSQLELLPR